MLPSPEEEEKLATIRAKMKPLEVALLSKNYQAGCSRFGR